MIARHWRGWTEPQNADSYEALLTKTVLPELRDIPGYRGGYVLRSDDPIESEFIVINLFDSLESVKSFAGEDYRTPVFEPEARALLSRMSPSLITTKCAPRRFERTVFPPRSAPGKRATWTCFVGFSRKWQAKAML